MHNWELVGSILNINGNVDKQDCEQILQSIDESFGLRQIQFPKKTKISAASLQFLNESVFSKHPKTPLRLIFNELGAFDNLNFLEHIPNILDLRLDISKPVDLSPIQKYLKLQSISIGGKKVDIRPLINNKSIEHLFLFKSIKQLEVVGEMIQLKSLAFSQIPLKNLDFILPLTKLESLSFYMGSLKKFEALPKIGQVKKLSFIRLRGLKMEQLAQVNQMPYLENIYLDQLPNIRHFDWLTNQKVQIEHGYLKKLRKNY